MSHKYSKSGFQIGRLEISLDSSFPNHPTPSGSFYEPPKQKREVIMNLIVLNGSKL